MVPKVCADMVKDIEELLNMPGFFYFESDAFGTLATEQPTQIDSIAQDAGTSLLLPDQDTITGSVPLLVLTVSDEVDWALVK